MSTTRYLLRLILFFCIFLLASCQTEGPLQETELSLSHFEAVIENPTEDTKTVLQNKLDGESYRVIYWQENDIVNLGGIDYRLTLGAGTTRARFTTVQSGAQSQMEEGKYKAYYPSHIYDPITKQLELPHVLTHATPENGLVVASNLPMYAESDGSDAVLKFFPIFSVLSFNLQGVEKVYRIEVTSATNNLSGPFQKSILNTAYTENYEYWEMTGTSEEDKKVVLDLGVSGFQLSPDAATEFLIPIPYYYSYRDDSGYLRYARQYPIGDLTIKIYGEDPSEPLYTKSNNVQISPSQRFIYYFEKGPYFRVGYPNSNATLATINYSSSQKEQSLGRTLIVPWLGRVEEYVVSTNMGYTVTITDSYGNSLPEGMILGYTSDEGDISLSTKQYNLGYTVSENFAFEPGTDGSNYTPKPFTVNADGDRVYFAPGNLLFRPSTNEWKFADRQFDTCGSEGQSVLNDVWSESWGTICENYERHDNLLFPDKTSSHWTDIFPWGTSGYTGWPQGTYGEKTHPCDYVTARIPSYPVTPEPFGPQDRYKSLTGDFEMGDWGVANRAALNAARTYPSSYDWRTPTIDEFYYILDSIPDNMPRRWNRVRIRTGSERYFKLTFTDKTLGYKLTIPFRQQVPTIDGILLYPDNFFDENPELQTVNGTIDPEIWLNYESKGCVFLPATTIHYFSSSSQELHPQSYDWIHYWTSSALIDRQSHTMENGGQLKYYTPYCNAGVVCWLDASLMQYSSSATSGYMFYDGWYQEHRYMRFPVRLVRTAE